MDKCKLIGGVVMPKVSVIMPAYNAEKYIGEAIESILTQTYSDFEFIIINDGSVDGTEKIINSYKDARIIYMANEKNMGIIVTLNKGLKIASGEYIVRMDADDISLPDRIEKQVEFMDKNMDIGVLGTGLRIFGEYIQESERIFKTSADELKAELLFNSCIAHPTVVIRKSVIVNNNLEYDKDFVGKEDFALWWEIAKVSKIATIPEVLLWYRVHGNQVTQKRNELDREVSRKLLEKRLTDLETELNENEQQSLLNYCRGEFEKVTPDSSKYLISALRKIMEKNKTTLFFEKRALQKVCGLAVTYTLQQAKIKGSVAKKVFRYAIRNKIYSNDMLIKLLCYKILKKI